MQIVSELTILSSGFVAKMLICYDSFYTYFRSLV